MGGYPFQSQKRPEALFAGSPRRPAPSRPSRPSKAASGPLSFPLPPALPSPPALPGAPGRSPSLPICPSTFNGASTGCAHRGAPPGQVVLGRPGASRGPPGTNVPGPRRDRPGQLSRGPPRTPRDAPRTVSRAPPGTLKFAILGVWSVSFSAFSEGFCAVFQTDAAARCRHLVQNRVFFLRLRCWLRCHAFRFSSHAYTNQQTAISDFLPAPGLVPFCASRPVFSLSTLGVFFASILRCL